MSTGKAPSWTPKRRGKVYCAPACGRGCTRAEYDAAVKKGNALLAQMKGSGWKVYIHENMGWYYRVISGPVQVYPTNKEGAFWCMIGYKPKDNAGGAGIWTSDESSKPFKDPNRAVRHALNFARDVILEYNKTLAAAEKAAGL